MSKEPSAAEKLIGDFAPKLVDLTDRVRGRLGTSPAFEARSQSRNSSRADRHESSGSVAVSPELCRAEWSHEGRID